MPALSHLGKRMATRDRLPDVLVNLEPPSLGARLDMLEEALRLLNQRTSQLRIDIIELRELIVLRTS